MFGLNFRKPKPGTSESGDTATPPELEDETGSSEDHSSSDASQSQNDGNDKPKKGAKAGQHEETKTAADVVNPMALLSEAIGHQALTLAKTNTVLKIAVCCLSITTVGSMALAASVWNKETEYRYFFMSSSGQLLENEPVTEPAVSLNIVRDFYADSLSYLFSFHYNNFDRHYQRIAPDIMTEKAMIDFSNELDRIGLIGDMEDRREVAEAVIAESPVLRSSGVDPATGAYTWEMAVPFNLRLESGLTDRNNIRRLRGVASVQIIRVSPAVHPRQFLINRITIRDTSDD